MTKKRSAEPARQDPAPSPAASAPTFTYPTPDEHAKPLRTIDGPGEPYAVTPATTPEGKTDGD